MVVLCRKAQNATPSSRGVVGIGAVVERKCSAIPLLAKQRSAACANLGWSGDPARSLEVKLAKFLQVVILILTHERDSHLRGLF